MGCKAVNAYLKDQRGYRCSVSPDETASGALRLVARLKASVGQRPDLDARDLHSPKGSQVPRW